jgi:hypothetical protein
MDMRADQHTQKCRYLLFVNLFDTSASYPNPTRLRMMCTSGGTLVRATVIVPNNPMLRLEKAAARGSVVKSSAVATAEEFAPKVIPRVM